MTVKMSDNVENELKSTFCVTFFSTALHSCIYYYAMQIPVASENSNIMQSCK